MAQCRLPRLAFSPELVEGSGPAISDTELLPDDIYNEALEIQAQIESGAIEPTADESCPS